MAARLDGSMFRKSRTAPRARFVSAFWRGRPGDRPRRGPSARRGPGTDSDHRPSAWATCHGGVRDHHTGPCLPPRCDASSAPLEEADLRQRYSPGWEDCQEQSANITLCSPSLILPAGGHPGRRSRAGIGRRMRRMCSLPLAGRARVGVVRLGESRGGKAQV